MSAQHRKISRNHRLDPGFGNIDDMIHPAKRETTAQRAIRDADASFKGIRNALKKRLKVLTE